MDAVGKPGVLLSSLRGRDELPATLRAENFRLRRENRALLETCKAWEEIQREYIEPTLYMEVLLWQIIESQALKIAELKEGRKETGFVQ